MTKKDIIIEKYDMPKPSDDLADRIIMAARKTPQQQTLVQRLISAFSFLQTPALSYSFASVLIIGLLVGGIAYNTATAPSPTTPDITIADLFDEDDGLLIL